MDRGCEQADEVVKATDKAKGLISELTKTVNIIQGSSTEVKNTMLRTRELYGAETPDMTEERLRIFAMPLREVRDELNRAELKSHGKSLRLRHTSAVTCS